MTTIAVPNMEPILTLYPLGEHEHYDLYILRTDGWPYGYAGSFHNPADIQRKIDALENRRSVIGVWVTKESDDGTVDITVFRHETLRR